MAYLQFKVRSVLGRRMLINGPPNSRKTTSLHTWPKPLMIVSLPGEKGYDSIDVEAEGIQAFVFQYDDVAKASAHATIKEVETLILEILAGKHGVVETLALDGIHKLYDFYYKRARLDLETSPIPDDTKDARAYGVAHDDFGQFITRISHSKVPYAVFTVWDGKELDNPDNKKGPSHLMPDLPGKMAKRIMGEFPIVLHAEVGLPPGPGKPAPAVWRLQPEGAVWGCSIKVPARIAASLPVSCAQDWPTLEKLLNPKEGKQ